ncbi:MAG TPA: DNA ligase D [Candidatus Binatia bacterium]|jgi:bifunctional non-homologous end joining protein LigD|nr:DNA ligase D [Candidatus Binatia bacterium]
MALDTYRRKRDFRRTPEPDGGTVEQAGGLYVIQKHAARRLHYDLRLELDGTLKSWAVPKGPSLDPAEKRLAVHVEDHPIEYGSFEGDIPKGEYGAGHVIVWDHGRWAPIGEPDGGYAKGKVKFTLYGEKLRGGWTLARMGGRAGEGGKNWLLLKERDAEARDASDGDILVERPDSVQAVDRTPLPAQMEPQLATLADRPPESDDWLHEIKWDGYRALCRIENGRVQCFSRSGQDWTRQFAPVAKALAAMPVQSAWVDGEVVVLGPDGRTSFEGLQEALHDGRGDMRYMAFDLLHHDGVDLRPLPLEQRKARLSALVRRMPEGAVHFSDHVVGRGAAFLEHAAGLGLEGVLSKQRTAPHRAGRHADWLKIRCHQGQEVVIGGFTDPAGSRSGLGALLVGVHETDGTLAYAGRVGTGFSDALLRTLRKQLEAIARKTSPFAPFPDVPPRTHWVEPRLVAVVRFTNWTRDLRMRHPTFEGMREDKPAKEVVREQPKKAAAAERPRRAADTETVLGVRLTHPDRALWPEIGLTKLELARFYESISDWILPHVADRPLSLVRGPRGHTGTTFFQKHRMEGMPDVIGTIRVDDEEHLRIDSTAGLVALVQIDVLEIHAWGARADMVEKPDRVVLDLDPAEDVPWEMVVTAARAVRLRLEHLDLDCFVKTTGGKGLHVVVPLQRRHDWKQVKAFAHAVASDLARRVPDSFTVNAAKAARPGKIYLDYLRNTRGATAVAAYSTRARAGAPVSTPLTWDELSVDVGSAHWTVRNLPARLAGLRSDPWKAMATTRQSITAAVRRELRLRA